MSYKFQVMQAVRKADGYADELRRKLASGCITPEEMGYKTAGAAIDARWTRWFNEELAMQEKIPDWYFREEAIWEEVNGCGHTYDSEGRRLD